MAQPCGKRRDQACHPLERWTHNRYGSVRARCVQHTSWYQFSKTSRGFCLFGLSFDDSSLRAFLWEPGGQMIDLNTLISPSPGIQLLNAATINDRGEMAVVADFAD